MLRTLVLALICAHAIALAQDPDRFVRPEDAPYFKQPVFVSLPLPRAYPGVEFNMRPAVIGGTWPYHFSLRASPAGMAIDARTGTITWLAPLTAGAVQVAVALVDQAGRTAEQTFTLTVGKEGFYFVSPSGDDANPGTFERPWKTVMRAAQSVADPAQATLYLRTGTYQVEVPPTPGKTNSNVLRITNTSPRRWMAWPGDKPVIDLGFTEAVWKSTLATLIAEADAKFAADPNADPAKKYSSVTTINYGHRILIDSGTNDLLFDGLEVKNANYFMFVMYSGKKRGITWRRCHLHHLYSDGAENPSFIFGYAATRTYERMPGMEGKSMEEACPWGSRPLAEPYLNTVVQQCTFSDRPYDNIYHTGHGGGIVWYTTQGSLIEDNRFEPMQYGVTISDKDNGWENTYRNNVFLSELNISGQGCADGIDIHHNYFNGTVILGKQPGWMRNIWFHHNAVRGTLQMMGGGARVPEPIDAAGRALDGPTDPECQAVVRDYPRDQRLVFAWANVIARPANAAPDFLTSRVPAGIDFANRWRFVWCDYNLVDEAAIIKPGYTRIVMNWSGLRASGVDVHGIQGKIELDDEGRLPADSPWRATYGRDAGVDHVPPPADTQSPSIPAGLVATAVASARIDLAWSAATDNAGVVGYRVYRGSTQIGAPAGTSFIDTGLDASTSYTYTVKAVDAAGNLSGASAAATATTPAAPPTSGSPASSSDAGDGGSAGGCGLGAMSGVLAGCGAMLASRRRRRRSPARIGE